MANTFKNDAFNLSLGITGTSTQKLYTCSTGVNSTVINTLTIVGTTPQVIIDGLLQEVAITFSLYIKSNINGSIDSFYILDNYNLDPAYAIGNTYVVDKPLTLRDTDELWLELLTPSTSCSVVLSYLEIS